MGITESEVKIFEKVVIPIRDSQTQIRKILPIKDIKADAESLTLEEITFDETVLAQTNIEAIEIPYKLNISEVRVIDLIAKITSATRTMNATKFRDISEAIGKIIIRSENYYGFEALKKYNTPQTITTAWDTAEPKDIAGDLIEAIIAIQDYTSAPVSLVLPTSKAPYVVKPNDYGLSPLKLVKGEGLTMINNVVISSLADAPYLVPNDSTIAYFARAKKLTPDKYVKFGKTEVAGMEAFAPVIKEKSAIIKLNGA